MTGAYRNTKKAVPDAGDSLFAYLKAENMDRRGRRLRRPGSRVAVLSVFPEYGTLRTGRRGRRPLHADRQKTDSIVGAIHESPLRGVIEL